MVKAELLLVQRLRVLGVFKKQRVLYQIDLLRLFFQHRMVLEELMWKNERSRSGQG